MHRITERFVLVIKHSRKSETQFIYFQKKKNRTQNIYASHVLFVLTSWTVYSFTIVSIIMMETIVLPSIV